MDRSSWSAISKDPNIWKKIAIGAGSLMLLLPTPIALGIVNTDLEAEVQRLRDKEPPGTSALPSVDDILKLLTNGLGPTLLYICTLLLFGIPTIAVLLSYAQLYIYFRPANELVPEMHTNVSVPFTSVILFFLILLGSLAIQSMASAMLPVALSQYARGKDLRPALALIPNAMCVVEMGAGYWIRVSGLVLGGFAMFIFNFFGIPWYLNLPLSFLMCAGAFVSLILSSRFALEHLAAELAPMNLPPLPKD